MNARWFYPSALAVCLTLGVGCEKQPETPAAPPAPKSVQGAAIDGSGDMKAPAPAAPVAPAAASAPAAATAPATTDAAKKPVTAAELQAATPKLPNLTPAAALGSAAAAPAMTAPGTATPGTATPAAAAPGAPAPGTQEHESYQQLLAQRQQTMDKPAREIPGYTGVAFSDLTSFGYMPKSPTRADALKTKLETETPLTEDDQIPTNIKQLDGKKIAVQGYMIPVDFEQGGTNDFLLVQVVPSCYFCQQPQPNEWIEVKTKDGKRIPYNGDDPMILTGTLDVGAKYKGGYFLSLYRMEADGSHTP